MRAHHAINFDPIAYIHVLRDAGCDQKLAEAHAQQQSEVISMLVEEQLVTKGDLKDLETVNKLESAEVKQAITNLKHEIAIRDEKIRHNIKILQSNIKNNDEKMQHNIKDIRQMIKTLNGTIKSEIKTAISHERQGLLIKLAVINTAVLGGLMGLFEWMSKIHIF